MDAAAGQHLGNFIVSDSHDLALLKRLAGRVGSLRNQLTIVVARCDIPRHRMAPHRLPAPPLQTLAQELSCTDEGNADAVMNYLIDLVSDLPCI